MPALSDFPRPKDDNGWGGHMSPSCAKPVEGTVWDNWAYTANRDYYTALRVNYGIHWVKILVDGSDGTVMHCKAAVDAGMEVIVRFAVEDPHPYYFVDPVVVRKYTAVGVHYFEWGNEPNLSLEWAGMPEGVVVAGHDKVVALCNQMIICTDAIVAGGGIALIPAMAPGNELDMTGEVVCYQSIINWFKAANWEWFKGHCDAGHIAIASHHRFGNHVYFPGDGSVDFSYPEDPVNQLGIPVSAEEAGLFGLDEYMRAFISEQRAKDKNPGATLRDDATCFRAYELIDDIFREALGYSLPILGTEAGAEPGDLWDGRYGRIDEHLHAVVNIEIFRRFNPNNPKKWRDSLFCECMWVWEDFGHLAFPGASWKHNHNLGRDLEAVKALEDLARDENFVRQIGVQPEIPPVEPPVEPSEPPIEPPVPPTGTAIWRVKTAEGQIGAYGNVLNAMRQTVAVGGYMELRDNPAVVITADELRQIVPGTDNSELEAAQTRIQELAERIEQAMGVLGGAPV